MAGNAASGSPASVGEDTEVRPCKSARNRFVLPVDPYQARAIRLAAEHPVLAIDGPPGTGKSQTLANIIAITFLAGTRPDGFGNRTALDVVKSRLDRIGLGDLCAVVSDPHNDPDPLYVRIRNCLEALPTRTLRAETGRELQETEAELHRVHLELHAIAAALAESPVSHRGATNGRHSGPTLPDLVGKWLSLETALTSRSRCCKGWT